MTLGPFSQLGILLLTPQLCDQDHASISPNGRRTSDGHRQYPPRQCPSLGQPMDSGAGAVPQALPVFSLPLARETALLITRNPESIEWFRARLSREEE